MENTSILHPDDTERSIAFKFTNVTDTDKEVYIKDITLYSFLRNIDWVNNVFSWVELREIPLKKLVCNPPDDTDNGSDDGTVGGTDIQPSIERDITDSNEGDSGEQPATGSTGDSGTENNKDDEKKTVPILCCLRIPPGTYKNTENIIEMINDKLSKLTNYELAIDGIQAIHTVLPCAYDISDIAIRETQLEDTSQTGIQWYPAIIDYPVVLNNFDISLDNTNSNSLDNNTCIPVLEYNANTEELSLPLEGSPNYNNLLLYNSDLISKMGSDTLTSHAVTFANGITSTLKIDKINININDLYASEYGLIRYRENGSNYTEFIINPSNEELINEITSKYATIKSISIPPQDDADNGNDTYPEITTEGNYKIFSCIAYPFFPVSTKLYLYNCNTPYVDKVIEARLSTERLFAISLASMEVDLEWTNQSQTTAETATRPYRAAETLDIVTSIKPHTVSINSIINIPSGSTTSIYVIGDNQRYPLWRSSHSLTYRVIN